MQQENISEWKFNQIKQIICNACKQSLKQSKTSLISACR